MAKVLLEIWQFEQVCLLKLSWGDGQSLDVQMAYPQASRDAWVMGLPVEKQLVCFEDWWLDGKLHDLREVLRGLLYNRSKGKLHSQLVVKYQDDPGDHKVISDNFSLGRLPWRSMLPKLSPIRLTMVDGNQRMLHRGTSQSEFLLEIWRFGSVCLFKLRERFWD
jgi:hypothetical protein